MSGQIQAAWEEFSGTMPGDALVRRLLTEDLRSSAQAMQLHANILRAIFFAGAQAVIDVYLEEVPLVAIQEEIIKFLEAGLDAPTAKGGVQ
jgi:hypothetical protein